MDFKGFLKLCSNGTPHEVQTALENDADIDLSETDDNGMTPLMLAAANNPDSEVAAVLLENGAEINATNVGMTALNWAALNNPNADVVNLLLKNGAETEEKSGFYFHGLPEELKELNALFNDTEIIDFLSNQDYMTALMWAVCFNRNARIVELLIENGADTKATTSEGKTFLQLAAMLNPSVEVAVVLMENGASVNDTDDDNMTALMAAAIFNPNPDVVKLLLLNGADINATDEDGMTALMLAVNKSHSAAITCLLENGADTHIKDRCGKRAIDHARENEDLKNTEIFKELLKASRIAIRR